MARLIGAVKFVGKFNDAVGMGGKRGKSFVRSAAASVANPRSMAQCIQRMICATAGVSIAPLKEICNNSVEGKRNGNETLSYLRGQWMRMLRVEGISNSSFNYAKKGSNFFIVNPYMLSKGSLAAPAVSVVDGSDVLSCESLNVGALIPADVFPQVAVGDQITIVAVALDDSGVDVRPIVKYCRFAFKNEAVAPFVEDAGGNKRLNPLAIDQAKAAGDWQDIFFEASSIMLEEFCGGFDLAAGALIVSNLTDKKRSTSYLKVGANILGTQYPASEAWRTFSNEATPIDVPSEVYLDNSTTPSSTNEIASMNFTLPVTAAALSGKAITMLSDVTLYDCRQHLRASTIETSRVLRVNAEGYLTDGADFFNSVTCSGNVITFGAVESGPSINSFVWE